MKRELMGLIVKRDDGSEQINYDDETFPSYIYDGWIKPNCSWEKVPHFHEDVELVTVKSGKMAYSVNGKIYTDHTLMDEIVDCCKTIFKGIVVKNDVLAANTWFFLRLFKHYDEIVQRLTSVDHYDLSIAIAAVQSGTEPL